MCACQLTEDILVGGGFAHGVDLAVHADDLLGHRRILIVRYKGCRIKLDERKSKACYLKILFAYGLVIYIYMGKSYSVRG